MMNLKRMVSTSNKSKTVANYGVVIGVVDDFFAPRSQYLLG